MNTGRQLSSLAQRLLQDRADQAERQRIRKRERLDPSIDPFAVTIWKTLAGHNPGYLPTTPMHMAKNGFWVACRACGQQFESIGMAYCSECMKLSADERREMRPSVSGRLCQAPGCENFISRSAKASRRFCSPKCSKRARKQRQAVQEPEDSSSDI
jgi:hypothetical protein